MPKNMLAPKAPISDFVRVAMDSTPVGEEIDGEKDMAIINRFAHVDLKAEDVFRFEFELSNTELDSHMTRFSIKSLENWKKRIKERGVPLMLNHNTYSLPSGYVYDAELSEEGSLMVRAYIVRGDEADGIKSDTLIRKIETGTQREASVGFAGGENICSICNRDYYGASTDGIVCRHVVGERYPAGDTTGQSSTKGELCTLTIDDSQIREASMVYKGSNPESLISKVLSLASVGVISQAQARSMQEKITGQGTMDKSSLVTSTNDMKYKLKESLERMAGGAKVNDKFKAQLLKRAEEAAEESESIEQLEQEVGEAAAATIAEVTEEADQKVAEAEAKAETLEEEAEIGRSIKSAKVEEVLAEGVRALGEAFDREVMATTLKGMTVEQLEKVRAQYKAVSEKVLSGTRAEESGAEGIKSGEGDSNSATNSDAGTIRISADNHAA